MYRKNRTLVIGMPTEDQDFNKAWQEYGKYAFQTLTASDREKRRLSEQEASELLPKVHEYLFKKGSVLGIAISLKIRASRVTENTCITFFLNRFMLREGNAPKIPREIGRFPTDIVITGFPRFHSFSVPAPRISPGESIANLCDHGTAPQINACGTLGCVVRDTQSNSPYFLTNWHVACLCKHSNVFGAGHPIHRCGNSGPTGLVGNTDRNVPTGQFDNLVDAALVEPNLECDETIPQVGQIRGSNYQPISGLPVKKYGAASGLTDGVVASPNAEVTSIDNGLSSDIHFKNQIILRGMARLGDSGSVIVDDDNQAVGLFFAGVTKSGQSMDEVSFANRIGNVESLLGVKVG